MLDQLKAIFRKPSNPLAMKQAMQIAQLDAALCEIESLPYRSRRAQEIARAARMARPGDYFAAKAQERVRQSETEGA